MLRHALRLNWMAKVMTDEKNMTNSVPEDIEDQRIRVLRVSNDDVLTNLDGVLERISRAVGVGPLESCRGERVDDG